MSACCGLESSQGRVSPELAEGENAQNVQNADESILNRNRKPTDIAFLVAYGLFLVIWVGLLGYCIAYGDIYRILNGYDNCGNICGKINVFDDINNSGCRGLDMTKHKYLRVQSWESESTETEHVQINRICVENCSNYSGFQTILNRCIPERAAEQTESFVSKSGLRDFFQEAAEDLHSSWMDIFYMCLIAFVFSIITLMMFKYLAAAIVWIVLIGVIVGLIAVTTLLWIHYKVEAQEQPEDTIGRRQVNTFLMLAIISTVTTVVLIVMIIFMRKRIKLVIVLFKEAGKATTSMPFILFEPILTFISLSIVIVLWLYCALWIESSGRLTIENNTSAQFVKDGVMKFTRWYNLMALYWTTQFLIACQHMVIAGAVATWYFTRNKNNLDAPIYTSLKNLGRYHLGTVSLGSLLVAVIQTLRAILRLNSKSNSSEAECLSASCDCCLGSCQSYLKYINRNAYIETAIYGDPFFTAGSKAFHKLMTNTLRVFTINTVGDFVLFLGKVFVVLITILFGMELLRPKEDIHHVWVPLTVAGLFAFLISHCFITVYEMIIDTIFLCFCEDCEINDGLSRPYYMSTGLMNFVKDSKKLLGINDIS